MTVHNFSMVHNTAQNSSDNIPSYLQTTIVAQMLSIGERGGQAWRNKAESVYVQVLLLFIILLLLQCTTVHNKRYRHTYHARS